MNTNNMNNNSIKTKNKDIKSISNNKVGDADNIKIDK